MKEKSPIREAKLTVIDRWEAACRRHDKRGDFTRPLPRLSDDLRKHYGVKATPQSSRT